MIRKLIFILFIFGFMAHSGIGQSMNAYLKAADKAYENEDYYSAMEFYAAALAKDTTRMDIRHNLAASARQFNAYSRAVQEYSTILMEDTISAYPDAAYWLGELNQKLGNYQEAIDKYELYLSEYGKDGDFLSKKANINIESANWALNEIGNANTALDLIRLGNEVNTPYTEFGAFPLDTALLFTSLRFEDKKSKRKPKHLKSKILSYNGDSTAYPLVGDINESEFSVAHNAFDRNMEKVYYTVCNYVTDSYLKCDIYCRDIDGSGRFVNPKRLPINSDLDSITFTQPTVGFDNEKNVEFLIFSSNRAGGKGGMDLWKVDILGDNMFGDIEPLENINTMEDEITPYYHNESNILYFSSNGKNGFGGYDVYSSDYIAGNFYGEYNLGSPVNSSFNDIYYTLTSDERISYLSSNRTGSLYIDAASEACCYDIYKGETENVFLDLNVMTFDQLTMDSLEGATVQLINPFTGDIIEEIASLDGIDHRFQVRRGRDYLIVSSKDGWNTDTMTLATRGSYPDNKIDKKVYLTTDRILLDLTTFDSLSLLPLNGCTVDVRIAPNGDNIYLNTLPNSNQFKIYLDPGMDYKIDISREGYLTETINLTVPAPSSDRIITRKVYLKKIGIDEYLPLYLYFDNDRPDPGSRDLYSPKAYSDIVNDYMARKDEFLRRGTASIAAAEVEATRNGIDNFFTEKVNGNYETFNKFLDELLNYLKAGRNANLTVKGYTSPLAANKYNLALGQRRVSSIKNEIARYRGGLFMPYLEAGQLVITDISFGEELAPENVSDRKSNARQSIYSVEASLERRIEILNIKIN